jgi:hypothetical protein
LLLNGVTDTLFYAAIYDQGFAVAGVDNVFLLPSSLISDRPGFRRVETYQLRTDLAARLAAEHGAEVYEVSPSGEVTNISQSYRRNLPATGTLPDSVDVGLPDLGSLLGPGWYGASGGIRWMGRRAVVHIAGPRTKGRRLRLRAIYPERNGEAVHLAISANGTTLGQAEILESREVDFPLPDVLVGAETLAIAIESDRTFRVPPDTRDLSVAFGVVELH